ncbi:MAG: Gmad2 immunoglobulin-like domain-containing protein, partial [Actinomycetota bacterium]|nr:Gmad2 immunoglobulin-like domain-containing protein [Actinomycetota bacterium]
MSKTWCLAVVVLLGAACGGTGSSGSADREPAPDASTPAVASPAPMASAMPTFPTTPCESRSAERYRGRPLIVVTEPCPRSTVTSPVTIAGEANVFEATVSLRIRDENGAVIAEGFTTATCGSGCWGEFEGSLEFSV